MSFRTISTLLTAPTLLLLLTLRASAQAPDWERLPGPYDGNTYFLIEDDTRLFVGTEFRGVQVSTDDGRSWHPYGSLGAGGIPVGIFSDRSLLVVTDDEEGVYRLLDGGNDYVHVGSGLPGRVVIGTVSDDETAYVLTREGFFRSADTGSSWIELDVPFSSGDFIALSAVGTRLLVAMDGDLWYSESYGDTIVTLTDSLPGAIFSGALAENGDMVIGTTQGVYRSSDSGRTFEYLGLDGERALLFLTVTQTDDGDYLIPGVGSYLFRVAADGSDVDTLDLPAKVNFSTTVLPSGTMIVADMGAGIWRSEDNGASFEQTGIGYGSTNAPARGRDSTELLSRTEMGIAISSDAGLTWENLSAGLETDGPYRSLVEVIPLPNRDILGFGGDGALVRWRVDGEREIHMDVLPEGRLQSVVRFSDGTLLAGNPIGAFRSTDDGMTWSPVDIEMSRGIITGDGMFWSSDPNSTLYHSSDGGESFRELNLDTILLNTLSLHATPDGGVYVQGRLDNENVQYVSFNDGATWHSVEVPCPGQWSYGTSSLGPHQTLAMTSECGIYLWDTALDAWSGDVITLPEEDVQFYSRVSLHGDHLFLGSSEGLFRTENTFDLLSAPGPLAEDVPAPTIGTHLVGNDLHIIVGEHITDDVRIEIVDMTGTRVFLREGVDGDNGRLILHLPESLPRSTYLITVVDGEGKVATAKTTLGGRN